MQTITEAFRSQLNIPLTQGEDPKVAEVLDYLAKIFQDCITKPENIAKFNIAWNRVKDAPRPDGNFVVTQEVVSDVTIDKIEKW